MEWINATEQLPAEAESVEVRLADGQKIKPVEFAAGVFWRVRQNGGGRAYDVEAWRSIEKKESASGSTEGSDRRTHKSDGRAVQPEDSGATLRE